MRIARFFRVAFLCAAFPAAAAAAAAQTAPSPDAPPAPPAPAGDPPPVLLFTEGAAPDAVAAARAARPELEPARSQSQARRQSRRVGEAVAEALNAAGYFDPSIDLNVSDTVPPRPLVRVDPGPVFSVGEIVLDVTGDPLPPDIEQGLREAMALSPGEAAIPLRVIDAERRGAAYLRESGYPFAEAAGREVVGDREARTISVTYDFNAGRRAVFGEVQVPEGLRTKTSYLRKLAPFEPGDPYDPEALARYNRRLTDTRLFDVARATLEQDGASPAAASGRAAYPVQLTLDERPRHTLELGGRYDTVDGAGLSADIVRRNFTGRGDRLEGSVLVSERGQQVDVLWRRPNEFGFGRGLILNAGIENEETDGFDRRGVRVGAGYEDVRSPRLTYTYGVTASAGTETDLADAQGLREELDVQSVGAYAGVRWDRADSVLDPTEGFRVSGRVAPRLTTGDREGRYVRVLGEVTGYVPVNNAKFVLAGRVAGGSSFFADADDLPFDARFYSGGGGSVRGYAFQAIGPRALDGPLDADGRPTEGTPLGGRSFIELSTEGRYRINDTFGAVAFVDAGMVSPSEFGRIGGEEFRVGLGVGVRYATPAGPIRFDIATPLNPTDRDDPVQVYISIGQAF